MTEPYDKSRRLIESFHSKKYSSTAINRYEEFPDQFLPTLTQTSDFLLFFTAVYLHVLITIE